MDTKISLKPSILSKLYNDIVQSGSLPFSESLLVLEIHLIHIFQNSKLTFEPEFETFFTTSFVDLTQLLVPNYIDLTTGSSAEILKYSKVLDITKIKNIFNRKNKEKAVESFLTNRLAMHQKFNFLNSYNNYQVIIKNNNK